MIEKNITIANDNVYLKAHCLDNTKVKKLDVMKLRMLLKNLGFNPVASGTTFIIEELKYFFENNMDGIKNLNQAYMISAQIHNISIDNVQWNVKSAIKAMNIYANKKLFEEIFYWYDTYNNVTPRFFMSTMITYLDENYEFYMK